MWDALKVGIVEEGGEFDVLVVFVSVNYQKSKFMKEEILMSERCYAKMRRGLPENLSIVPPPAHITPFSNLQNSIARYEHESR